MKEAINYFQERFLTEKTAKDLIRYELNIAKNKLSQVEIKNEKLKVDVSNIEKEYEKVNKSLTIYKVENENFIEQLNRLKYQNDRLINLNR